MKKTASILSKFLVTLSIVAIFTGNVSAQVSPNTEENVHIENVVLVSETVNDAVELIKTRDQLNYTKNLYTMNQVDRFNLQLEIAVSLQNFDENVYYLKQYVSEDDLKSKYGYSNDQIYGIKNFDGSDEMRVMAATSTYHHLILNSYTYSAKDNETIISISYNASIDGHSFLFQTNANAALGVFGSEANFLHVNSYLTARYGLANNRDKHASASKKFLTTGSGVTFEFPIKRRYEVKPIGSEYFYLRGWSSQYVAIAGGKVTISAIESAWATKGLLGAGIGLSFSKKGVGLSISPATGWTIHKRISNTVKLPK